MQFIPAPKMLLMAIPVSTSVIRETPGPIASAKISMAVANAPKNAAKGNSASMVGKNAEHNNTISPAPELTPMMLGLANGFCSTDCQIAPDTDKALPASRAPNTPGNREYITIR